MERFTIVADYEGKNLEKVLKNKPVRLEDCDQREARNGNIDQQVCLAKAYLTVKNCKEAELWAMKAFDKDAWNKDNEPVLDLLGILQHEERCVD